MMQGGDDQGVGEEGGEPGAELGQDRAVPDQQAEGGHPGQGDRGDQRLLVEIAGIERGIGGLGDPGHVRDADAVAEQVGGDVQAGHEGHLISADLGEGDHQRRES